MAVTRYWAAIVCSAVLSVAACNMDDPSDRELEHPGDTLSVADTTMPGVGPGLTASKAAVATAGGIALTSAGNGTTGDSAAMQARNELRADSTDRMLRHVSGLTRWEQVKLRRDVNMIQISRARQLGITPGSDPDALLKAGRLVKLEDSTKLWTLHNLNYSVPYVTPSTESLIAEIGERFQLKLDSMNVPRFRLVITSVLRTADKQALLRKHNWNASKIVSAHEFGTTVDLAYRRFAAPHDSASAAFGLNEMGDSLMVKTANRRSSELQAVLGRVLANMEKEGKVMVMMERNQTVYHITLAQAYPHPKHVAAE